MPRGELQIIRTRHPPATYLNQLCDLLGTEGITTTPTDLSNLLDMFPEKDRLILAVEGDQLVGYAHIRIVFDPIHGPIAEVAAIIVQPHRRREGFGRRLVAAAETWARQSKRSYLRLSSDVARTAGHAFFTALGYEQDATKLEFMRELDA
jgi:GNAT superfamily N-acetyltransferase